MFSWPGFNNLFQTVSLFTLLPNWPDKMCVVLRSCSLCMEKSMHCPCSQEGSHWWPIKLSSDHSRISAIENFHILPAKFYLQISYREQLYRNCHSKGFYPNISGTLEHTAQMGHVINQARVKQWSLVVTLLDLKNAFGEVHHNLIQEVLSYHHIPERSVRNLYTNFKTSIITQDFNTPFITVGRGVLQGDCWSPLLFNLCFNTFIQHIKSDEYRQCGFFNKSVVNGYPPLSSANPLVPVCRW